MIGLLNLVDTALQFLLTCLRDSRLSNASASSLDKVCDHCASEQRMIQNFPTLLQIVKDVDSFHIKSDATIKLIKGKSKLKSDSTSICVYSPNLIWFDILKKIPIVGEHNTP